MGEDTTTSASSARYIGIDFSGNAQMWSPGCSRSNVWIAEVELACSGLVLTNLRRVQQLNGSGLPFARLVQYLRESEFVAAAIDAPFSVPAEYWLTSNHRELLRRLFNRLSVNAARKPFLSAREFVSRVVDGKIPSKKKPLRQTEEYWQQRGINVRSTLWDGPRGGAAMTAACLQLLFEADRPIWPWEKERHGLLIEAFPAAQLRHWGLRYQAYNGNTESESHNRHALVRSLSERIDLRNFREMLKMHADALDAVICSFAAIAVSVDALHYETLSNDEGRIAVHR